ncbi:RICIN domain-containing protein, partial [Bifidobacterium minimum]
GTAAQNWSVIVYDDSSFALVNDASGKVVDVPSGNAVANAKLQSYAANGVQGPDVGNSRGAKYSRDARFIRDEASSGPC